MPTVNDSKVAAGFSVREVGQRHDSKSPSLADFVILVECQPSEELSCSSRSFVLLKIVKHVSCLCCFRPEMDPLLRKVAFSSLRSGVSVLPSTN